MKRVVVTGIGIVSCLGNNQNEVYKSLLDSKSGISFSEEYKEYNLKSHVHGKPNIKLEDHVDRKFIRFMGPGSAYNYISMNEAVKDSGLDDKGYNIIAFPTDIRAIYLCGFGWTLLALYLMLVSYADKKK